jgi:acetyl-CoA acetyltransferase
MVKQTAVVGVGYTDFSAASGRTVLELATAASRAALADAGLVARDVDGIATYAMGDSVPAQGVATSLGLGRASYFMDLQLGGQAPSYLLLLADAAIKAGLADTIVLFRALNGRSGTRLGRTQLDPELHGSAANRYAAGLTAYPQHIAMWARRYMIETGATEADLGAVVMSQRAYAAGNDRAILRKPITREEYLASPMIASPFRLDDCTREVDGACALVVTSLERARDLRQTPVVVLGGAFGAGPRSGGEVGDILLWDDYTTNCIHHLSERLWRNAGISPEDVDVAELYDCFSSAVLYALEGLGFVGRGEAGAFIRDGHTEIDGTLPVNTHGGLLCEGYLHGMNSLAEGVLQMRGGDAERFVKDAETAVVTSGTLMDGSAVVLARGDR